jgi:hypothetical protein
MWMSCQCAKQSLNILAGPLFYVLSAAGSSIYVARCLANKFISDWRRTAIHISIFTPAVRTRYVTHAFGYCAS